MLRAITDVVDRTLVASLRPRGIRSQYVKTSIGRVHVLRAPSSGSLPPVLVIHGFAAAAHYYANVIHRIRPFVRHVIAPDIPGHGLSDMPPDLRHETVREGLVETLDQVLDEPAVVFGNSLGGAAAIRYAVARPEMVLGLFLVAPGGAAMTLEDLSALQRRFDLRDHGESVDFVDRLFAKRHPLRHLIAYGTRHQFQRPGLQGLLRDVAVGDLIQPAELSSLSMPVHVVWGGADRVLSPVHFAYFREHLPHVARMEVVDHFGHTPHIDHCDDVHDRLLTFVKEVASGSADRPNLLVDSAGQPLDLSGPAT